MVWSDSSSPAVSVCLAVGAERRLDSAPGADCPPDAVDLRAARARDGPDVERDNWLSSARVLLLSSCSHSIPSLLMITADHTPIIPVYPHIRKSRSTHVAASTFAHQRSIFSRSDLAAALQQSIRAAQ